MVNAPTMSDPNEDDAPPIGMNPEQRPRREEDEAAPTSPEQGPRAPGDDPLAPTRRDTDAAPADAEGSPTELPGTEATSAELLGTEAASTDLPGTEAASTDPPGTEAAPSEPALSEAQAWTGTSRSVALFGLLGMALPTWVRLSRDRELTLALLQKNHMPMPERDAFLLQILGGGLLLGLAALAYGLFWPRVPQAPRRLERVAWFLSPLILLPAIPVMGCYEAWHTRHETFLPIVLFLTLLTEFFVSRSILHAPKDARDALSALSWIPGPRTTGSLLARHGWLALAICGALFYAIFMSYFTVRWHNSLGTATFDLGINNNLIYGGLHGKINQSTVIFPDDPQKYIANHLKLGLYFFLPIYALHPKAETLLIIQSVSLGLGAIPLFLFARQRIPEWAACVLAFAYLAYYPMHGANFYEMKLVPTAAAFVLTMIWAVDRKRWITAGVFFVMSLLMREDVPVPLAVVGGFLLLSGYRPRAGVIICGISVFWFVLVRFKVMTDAGAWWFPNMYEDLWSEGEKGFRSVLKTLVSNPTFVLEHIFTEKKFWYLMHLLVPIAFLPVRRWYLWAALVPGAILTLLVTNYDPPVMFSFQYVMHWSPYLFVASALAVSAIAKHAEGRARAPAAILAVAVASGALAYNYSAFPLRDRYLEAGYHKIKFGWTAEDEKQFQEVKALIASIPKDASVATTERIGAHLSSRVKFYTLRRGTHGATYLVARRSGLRLGKTKAAITDALTSGEYGVAGRYGEFIVFKQGADTKENESVLDEWKLRSRKEKDRSRRRRLDDRPTAVPQQAGSSEPADAPEEAERGADLQKEDADLEE